MDPGQARMTILPICKVPILESPPSAVPQNDISVKMKILIGTTNKGKQEEFRRIIDNIVGSGHARSLHILFPQDISITDKPEEIGRTFADNSLLKAKFYFEKSGIPTIADDGGLEIPILNNEPGVRSRRWLGYEASDEEILHYTLKRMEEYEKKEDRKAVLKTCLTYFDGKNFFQEFGAIEGYLADKSNKNYIKGYPFRSLFRVLPIEKYYDELSPEEHNLLNHREKALKQLWRRIKLVYN